MLAAAPLASAVKQVKVTAERASIYIEPSRSSARIDIVGKGTVLNLLQERKVKDIWYYVSFHSPRYGTRISGFIQETAVELAGASPPAPSKKAAETPPQAKQEEVRPPELAPPPQAEPKKEVPKAPPSPPELVETLALTKLPRSQRYQLPHREGLLQEAAWKTAEMAPVMAKKAAVEVREFSVPTLPPKRRTIALPRKEKTPEDAAWQVIQPIMAKATQPAEKPVPKTTVESKPAAPEVKKQPAEKKTEARPAEPQPVRAQKVRPARRGPGFITFGLGYGSSFGGAGGCLQLNMPMGLSLHAGAGLYPTTLIFSETDWVKNKAMWSVGLKYYLPFGSQSFSPFVDLQYGGLRVEAAQVIVGIWDYNFIMSYEQKTLWGPSGLAGVELRIGRFGISAAAGASYATTSWEYLENKVSFVFDAGLVIHF
jgi:hypothetical protein